ncbi:hypothetical protein CY0110_28034 [Crocosphaera chwakensis CCY0110]|uniref:Uncharacterized protein n=1 Tax=Crocosphaera chwakensis CCY0110 TaxID=391612 RepID=A3IMB5_9CHRO|nr:hypothetical protein CY0110_28034 [Crocosphaera chwakensis CCY0110]
MGNIEDVAKSWEKLAHLYEDRGRIQDAELWYRKAIEGSQQSANQKALSEILSNNENNFCSPQVFLILYI